MTNRGKTRYHLSSSLVWGQALGVTGVIARGREKTVDFSSLTYTEHLCESIMLKAFYLLFQLSITTPSEVDSTIVAFFISGAVEPERG